MKTCKECNSEEVMNGESEENFDGDLTVTIVCLDCGNCAEEIV